MQEREFDKLVNGKPAKWAELTNPQTDINQLNKSLNNNVPLKFTLLPGETKSEQREKIQANEIPVPDYIRDEIYKYVKTEREKKTSERAIRRAVKRKWNIYVV